jgi:hypothetical protein
MGPLPTLRNIMSSSLFICQILHKLLNMPSQVEATLREAHLQDGTMARPVFHPLCHFSSACLLGHLFLLLCLFLPSISKLLWGNPTDVH